MGDYKTGEMAYLPGGKQSTKVDHYGWTMTDSPGELLHIRKDLLEVDHCYQREVSSHSKILAIARAWSWKACGAIAVSRRKDGRYFVYDGQHRVAAANMRADIYSLPCLVFPSEAIKEEAESFLLANTNRKPLSGSERFRGQIQAGVTKAVTANQMLEAAGWRIANGTVVNGFNCIGTLTQAIENYPDAITSAWPLIVEMHPQGTPDSRLIYGLVYIENAMSKQGRSINQPAWRSRFFKIGSKDLVKGIVEAIQYHGKGGNKVYAEGILKRVNKGCRNLLTLDTIPSE